MNPETYYHIYTHANGFENLFRVEDNYRFFLKRYDHFISPIADTLAWCLMPNHVHFLIRIKSEADLELSFGKFETFEKIEYRISKQFSNLFSSYTQAFNKVYKRRESLFIPNFKRKEIDSDLYLTRVIAYIHNNPVNHGFTQQREDWIWSSYQTLLDNRPTKLKQDTVRQWFGNQDNFIKIHNTPLEPHYYETILLS